MSLPEPAQQVIPPTGVQESAGRSPGTRFFWMAMCLLAAVIFSSGMQKSLRPTQGAIFDFFKEWAAVQNWRSEMPLYTPQRTAIQKHLGLDLADEDGFFDPYNTHPPTANLFAIPFGWLSYRDAQFAWNLASLALLAVSLIWIARELKVSVDGTVFAAAATLLLASDPLQQTLIQGQPNLLLGFLIVAAWRANRRGNPWLSGSCLAVAAAIKLYPAYLFLFALARRDWKTLTGGLVAGLAITVVTAAVFGVDAYRDYVQVVLPELRNVTNNWGNSSLLAFWERLFGQPVSTVSPLITSPIALKASLGLSALGTTAFAAWAAFRADSRAKSDAAFGIVILAMLLMSPTTWHHYFVLAAIPACVALVQSASARGLQITTWIAIAALTMTPRLCWLLLIRDHVAAPQTGESHSVAGRIAVPWQSLTALSYQMYALLLLMAVLWQCFRRNALASLQRSGESHRE